MYHVPVVPSFCSLQRCVASWGTMLPFPCKVFPPIVHAEMKITVSQLPELRQTRNILNFGQSEIASGVFLDSFVVLK